MEKLIKDITSGNDSSDRRIILNETLRVFLFISLLLLVGTLLMLYFNKETIVQNAQKKETEIVNSSLSHIQSDFNQVVKDLLILVKSSQVANLWADIGNEDLLDDVAKDFLNVAKYQRDYDQIRLVDNKGFEVIRVNFNDGHPSIVAPNQLQNKGNRYYFKEAIKKLKNEVFVSVFDLNVEHERIEKPLKPMIRFGTPVFDRNGSKRGVLILNYLGKKIINNFSNEDIIGGHQLYLLNSDGYYLKGKSPEMEWGFMFEEKKEIVFGKLYAREWDSIKSKDIGHFKSELGLFTFNTVYPFLQVKGISNEMGHSDLGKIENREITDSHQWKIVSFIPNDDLMAEFFSLQKNVMILFPVVLIILFYILYVLTKSKQQRLTARKKLKEVNESFQMAMNEIDAVVYVSDLETYDLLFYNETFKNNFGDFPGKKCFNILQKGQDSPCAFCTNHLLVNENGEPNDTYIWEFQNTLTGTWYQCRDRAIRWTDGRLVRLEIATDISDRKKAEQDLIQNKKELLELNATKDKFFSIIAHDLRSPLGSLLNFTQQINKNIEDFEKKKLRQVFGMMNESLKGIFSLLENLLEWSRIQTQRIDFYPHSISLNIIYDEVLALLSMNASKKKINIKYDNAEDCYVWADRYMLASILRNLLSNAIKFTQEEGTIKISHKKIVSTEGKSLIEITVADSGVGMESEVVEKLFRIEYNTSMAGTAGEKGSGIGLVLCREFVEINGGMIKVKSNLGKGSQFIFTIPEDTHENK